jgi:ACR3 family arsenite transporter
VVFAQWWRARILARAGQSGLDATLDKLHPISLSALLLTLVLLFGFQGEQILAQPLVIVLIAVPILIQVYFNSGLAYLLNRRFGVAHCVAGPSALIGASNFLPAAGMKRVGRCRRRSSDAPRLGQSESLIHQKMRGPMAPSFSY